MKRISLFTVRTFALVSFLLLLASCAEEPLGGSDHTGEGYTITLHLATTVSPIYDTEALIQPSTPGGEADEAGFDYEIVSSDADSITFSLETKAPTTLKNVYALLFTSSGAFNGRASIGTITAGSALSITFTNVVATTANNCRLVIVANDNAAVTSYASSGGTGGFAGFSGTYADFQKLMLTSAVTADSDIPYAGSTAFTLSEGEVEGDISVLLYRTLAKITFNNTFSITGGPARNNITLYNAGERRFATPGSDNYDGSGSTGTTAFVATTAGSNANTNVWYVGENIRPAGSGVSSGSDRNSSKAPANACYIRVGSASQAITGNTNPSVGQEYIQLGSLSFTYDIYLGKSSDVSDFSLRRHTNYMLTTSVSGTLSRQEELSRSDGRVALTKTGAESAGLCIGLLGGASGYTTGTGAFPTISGSYTKYLLLQPNTSGTTAADNVTKSWSTNTSTQLQTETRRAWDPTYTLNHIDKSSGFAYDYCYNLTLGGVAKGTWYLPTQLQLGMIYGVVNGLKGSSAFAGYNSFVAGNYWSSTENGAFGAWYVYFSGGNVRSNDKSSSYPVRCVRDIGNTLSTQMVTTVGGYPVVDLSSFSPLGCLFTSTEASTRRTQMNAQSPSNSAFLGVGASVSGTAGTWNAKLSPKFQMMRADQGGGADWSAAYTRCKQYAGEGGVAGQWRLPTQLELIWIAALHPQLRGISGFSSFGGGGYWSSTESGTGSAWCVSFSDGYVDGSNKSSSSSVRCVRDI